MRTVKLVVVLVLVTALVVVVLQNQASWQVRLFWLTGEAPGIVVLFLTAATGFIAGVTAALLVKRGTKPRQTGG